MRSLYVFIPSVATDIDLFGKIQILFKFVPVYGVNCIFSGFGKILNKIYNIVFFIVVFWLPSQNT